MNKKTPSNFFEIFILITVILLIIGTSTFIYFFERTDENVPSGAKFIENSINQQLASHC